MRASAKLALVGILFTFVVTAACVKQQAMFMAITPKPIQLAAADEIDDEPEQAPAVPTVVVKQEPGSPIQKVTVKLNVANSFAKAGEQYGMDLPEPNSDPNIRQASFGHSTSLPQISVKPPAPKPEVWTATLDDRQAIARNFLARVCPKILSLEKMQSAATMAETNARFMRAKNAGQVIGSVKAELRGHSNVVWTMCPADFYAKLFAQK